MPIKKPLEGEVRVKTTLPVKLKDKDKRHYQAYHLKELFGFVPEIIIVEKVQGKNNTFILRAIMTPEAIKAEDKKKKALGIKDSPKIILPK